MRFCYFLLLDCTGFAPPPGIRDLRPHPTPSLLYGLFPAVEPIEGIFMNFHEESGQEGSSFLGSLRIGLGIFSVW